LQGVLQCCRLAGIFRKLAEQAAKIITLPVNTREVSNCP
jgi:hypothetical protein